MRQFSLTARPLGGDLRAHAVLGGEAGCPAMKGEGDTSMNRAHLVTLHAAMSALLALPPSMLDEIARWLAPAKAQWPRSASAQRKGPRSAPIASPSPRSTPQAGKTRHDLRPTAKTAERKLIAAMQASPGSSIAALANATDVSRSTMERRLQRLAAAGQIEKDHAGRWRPSSSKPLAEEARPARVEPRPPSPSL